jgi:hypothetical protein
MHPDEDWGILSIVPGYTTLQAVFKNTDIDSITIPDSITELSDGCFFGCSEIKEIVIPDSVRTIGADCFKQTYIQTITLGKNVGKVGDSAFAAYTRNLHIRFRGNAFPVATSPFGSAASLFLKYSMHTKLTANSFAKWPNPMDTEIDETLAANKVIKISGSKISACENLP